ncbi:MAG TPA: GNAT family N-acetyltransferase [Thermomicrobiales bacterium]|jgi:ribosomal protein S18 acetylase RimI-like enzyme
MTTVTLATVADALLVHRIMIAAFEEYRGVLEPPSSTHQETVEDVRRAFDTGGAVLAWISDEAVGSARFQPRPDYLYVGRVSTLPKWRGRGIASALMTFLEGHARTLGLPEIRVEVRLSLPSNVALYRRLGFHTVSEQPHPRGPAFKTVILGKRV